MELGGVSVPGRSQRDDGAYLLKDLSVFEARLGGLRAFVMVSNGTGDDERGDAAAHLAVRAADSHLDSILLGVAAGKSRVVEPAATLRAIVAEANTAIMSAAAEAGASSMGATFTGAFVSEGKAWFGQVGEGRTYLLRGGQAHELVVETAASDAAALGDAPGDGQIADATGIGTSGLDLGTEGVSVDIGSVDLGPGDVVVVCGREASSALSGSDILGISCAACDSQVAAVGLAGAAAKAEPDGSVTVAIWSSDSSLFAPPPPPPPPPLPVAASPTPGSPAPIIAANDGVSRGPRAERIFIWVMAVWIVLAFSAMVAMALVSKYGLPARTAASSSTAGAVTQPASLDAAVATATQDATAVVPPAEAVQAEYPKTLIVPKNVKGGLWLRKKPSTLGASNLVIQLKGGAELQAEDIADGKDASGKTQKFYVFKVADITSDQVVETSSYSWPPSKSLKLVYGFAGSFEAPQ
jgi:hypothetical protein